jgi:predicted double-glycine peptidase
MRVKDILTTYHLAIQEASFSCGPVSILNVLRLKGDFSHNEEELIKLCDAKLGIGSSNENVVKAAKLVGLKVVEEKTDASIADLEKQLDTGAYIIINYCHAFSDLGHYAVITDYDNEALYFADSSLGFLRLRKNYLEKFWYNSDKTIYGWYVALK